MPAKVIPVLLLTKGETLHRSIVAMLVAALALAGCGGGIVTTPISPNLTSAPGLTGPGATLAPAMTGSFTTSLSGCSGTCNGTSLTVNYPITVPPTGMGSAIGVSISIVTTSYSLSNGPFNALGFPTWELIAPDGAIYFGQSVAGPGYCFRLGCAWTIPFLQFFDGSGLPPITGFTAILPESAFSAPAPAGTWQLVISSTAPNCGCTGSASWLVAYEIQQGT